MGRKILIIDDDKEFLEELQETLLLSGYEVVSVDDANLALKVAGQVRPVLILLDLRMPNKSGFQLANELKEYSQTSNVPIIAMSGFFKEEYIPLLDLCGIKKCLKKPFNPLDVIAQIESEALDN